MAPRPSCPSYPPSPFVAVFDFQGCSDPACRRCDRPDPWKHAAPPEVNRRPSEPVVPIPPAAEPDRFETLDWLHTLLCDLAHKALLDVVAEAGRDTPKRDRRRPATLPFSSEVARIVQHFDSLPDGDPLIGEIVSVAAELHALLLEHEGSPGQ